MRVLAGKYKSKKIQTINNSNTRPMMSKVREAIFNSIQFLIDDKDDFSSSSSILSWLMKYGLKPIVLDSSNWFPFWLQIAQLHLVDPLSAINIIFFVL